MVDLRGALDQLDQIQTHLERTESFRGYRSQSVAFSGILGIVGCVVQATSMNDPVANLDSWLLLWVGIAFISVAVVGVEIVVRCYRSQSRRELRSTRTALRQFVPTLITGAVLTHVIVNTAVEVAWMLPGLWAIIFGLGVFSSLPLMPERFVFIAAYYVAVGLLLLVVARDSHALSPWAMSVFAVGQLISSVMLYVTLEKNNV